LENWNDGNCEYDDDDDDNEGEYGVEYARDGEGVEYVRDGEYEDDENGDDDDDDDEEDARTIDTQNAKA